MTTDFELIEKIAAAGGGIIFDAYGVSFEKLLKIAVAAKLKDSTIIFSNIRGFDPNGMVKLVQAGGRNVIFDLTE